MTKIEVINDIVADGFEKVEFLPEFKEILKCGLNRLIGLESYGPAVVVPNGVEVVEYNPTLDLGLRDTLTPSTKISMQFKLDLIQKFQKYFAQELEEINTKIKIKENENHDAQNTDISASISGHKLSQFLLASSLSFEVRATSVFPLQANVLKDKTIFNIHDKEQLQEVINNLTDEQKIKLGILSQIERISQSVAFLDGTMGELTTILAWLNQELKISENHDEDKNSESENESESESENESAVVFEIPKEILSMNIEDFESSLIGKSLSLRMLIDFEVPFEYHDAAEVYFNLIQSYYLSLFRDVNVLLLSSPYGILKS